MSLAKMCKVFLNNPTINPETGRKIQKGKGVYNKLMKVCAQKNLLLPAKKRSKIFSPKTSSKKEPKKIKSSKKDCVSIDQKRKNSKGCFEMKATRKVNSKPIVRVSTKKIVKPNRQVSVQSKPKIASHKDLERNYKECAQHYFTLPKEYVSALLNYQKTWYASINKYLWEHKGKLNKKDFDLTDAYEKEEFQTADNLFKVIRNGLTAKADFIAYRNFVYGGQLASHMSKEYAKKMTKAKIGESLPYYGFLSLSALKDADPIIKNPDGIGIILIPKGKRYICPGRGNIAISDEKEIILAPGTLTKISLDSPLGTWMYN